MAATMAAATMAFITSPARLTPGIAFSALIAALAAMLLFGSDIDRACPRCSAHGRLFGKQTYSCVEILVESGHDDSDIEPAVAIVRKGARGF